MMEAVDRLDAWLARDPTRHLVLSCFDGVYDVIIGRCVGGNLCARSYDKAAHDRFEQLRQKREAEFPGVPWRSYRKYDPEWIIVGADGESATLAETIRAVIDRAEELELPVSPCNSPADPST